MRKIDTLYIIHEYGDRGHYLAAIEAINAPEVKYLEFSTLRIMFRGLKKKNIKVMLKAILDFIKLTFIFIFPQFLSNKIVIIGVAPLDWRIYFLNRILKKSKNIYHTSWHSWSGDNFPYRTSSDFIKKQWEIFLHKTILQIAAVTDKTSEQLQEYMGIAKEKIIVVYHSYKWEVFKNENPNANYTDKISVLYLGRLVEEKGVREIIKITKGAKDINFDIIGDGYLRDMVITAAKENDNLSFHGHLNDRLKIAAICKRNDIIILPSKKTKSWEELFGMAMIEAMASGCVPMTTDHIGPKIIIGNDEIFKNNIFTENDCWSEFHKKVNMYSVQRELLFIDKKRAINLAKNFTIESIAERWKTLFEKIV
ncbi:Glycogen synthase [Serratia fonticola]|uniref:glycosyltransferase family 4 protein n=1 Tax=Serratia fonticola TaxID=47917 RepID=UPI0021783821|nr:glycosyltransferase family 4 protein [Serratia fonticola]CAI0964420.1 Glycogen synthase [Serratia fonticola]